jgi:hypothetical protein
VCSNRVRGKRLLTALLLLSREALRPLPHRLEGSLLLNRR